MNKLFFALLVPAFLSTVVTVQASVIPLTNGEFEIAYNLNSKGTISGNDITDIFIFETNGTQTIVDYTFSPAAQGTSIISHAITFNPTLALVIGLDQGPSRDDVVMFMDNGFAAYALTKPLFADVFPAVDGRTRVRESVLIQAIKDAQLGDFGSLQLLTDFFIKDAGKFAAFNPADSFTAVEFSQPVQISVDEPTTMMLFSIGMVAIFLKRRQIRQ